MKKILLILCTSIFFLASCNQTATTDQTKADSNSSKSLNLDLDKPEDNLQAFTKVRGSLKEGEEVLYYADGMIYGFIDGERDKAILGFEMYNIARLNKTGENEYELLTREVGLYKDPKTGEILDKWLNPYTEEEVDVLHVWNDPVNQQFKLEGRFGPWGVNHAKVGDDMICMNADIFLKYPSPLPIKDYPENSQSDSYEAGELFQFFFSEKDVNNPDLQSVPCHISWTRIAPWLPWMKMGQRPGNMVYQCSGYKLLEKDYDTMPKKFREYILANKPEYRHAPTEYTKPNETSWTYYKKMNPKE